MPALTNYSGFVEAAVLDDAELFNPAEFETTGGDDAMDGGASSNARRRIVARQRFSKRQVAFMSPRLGLLNNLPMAVPFMVRLRVFSELVA